LKYKKTIKASKRKTGRDINCNTGKIEKEMI